MEPKALNKLKLLRSLMDSAEEIQNKQADSIQIQLNHHAQLLTSRDLEMKWFTLLNRTNNSPEVEEDFRRTCALFKDQKSASSPQLNQSHQKYVDAYHKLTTLYMFEWNNSNKNLVDIYDTEKETQKFHKLKAPMPLCHETARARLPNGELFCFGDWNWSGITLILDQNYKFRILPSGMPCRVSSAIYFDRNVYCFGGIDNKRQNSTLSCRFDLDANRWVNLTPMPKKDYMCHCAIFNREIVITDRGSNLLLYSIDIDSFSKIPCGFTKDRKKIIINAERLYLIECSKSGWVYESEAEGPYAWKKIINSAAGFAGEVDCVFNKGAIYIVIDASKVKYYKFDLSQRKMFKLLENKQRFLW